MSDSNSTRSPFRPTLLRRHAALAVEIYRQDAPATLEQLTAIARIRVRLAARGNRHELGAWRRDAGVDVITCSTCGARARLELSTGLEDVRELLARRCS